MENGYFALVLHAHLPFVRHLEGETYLEERWLLQAITETYIPLLQVFQGLVDDGVNFKVTISLSPTLVTMLTDELLQNRYSQHLDLLIELAELEVLRTESEPEINSLAKYYLTKFTSIKDYYQRCQGNLVTAFREFQDLGKIEIITSAATHAFLPLILTQESIRAQISTAIELHRWNFGQAPKGIWLPECGYSPDFDQILQEFGLQYFFVDSHGVGNADPAPVFSTFSPVLTPHGIAAFPRDQESSRQVWSSTEGYPGDFDYREYYRDVGFDLDLEIIRPYIHPDGIRLNTGIKYYRITGTSNHKELYNPQWARAKAAEHAANFIYNRQKQVEYWTERIGRKPIIVSPYDAELFGHWWYEGPMWIDLVFRKLHFDQHSLQCITPSEYLQAYSDYQVTNLPLSSWGRGGCADVWLRGENDWIYPALHLAEQQMVKLAEEYVNPSTIQLRTLNQAARELMLAQGSDWAFMMDNRTMVDYAVKRTKHHINRFFKLFNMLEAGEINHSYLAALELQDNIFPDLSYTVYKRPKTNNCLQMVNNDFTRLLVLSWEFPPVTVGGLSRHVFDLSRFTAKKECEIHVVTTGFSNSPEYEVIEGVHIHRVKVLKPDGEQFLDWVLQLNLAMIDKCQTLASQARFDLMHVHDWLVCYAAKTLKRELDTPLIATIHATEHGRNNGLFSELQRFIHKLERDLSCEASKVIVCSRNMQDEVKTLFELSPDKVFVIPNGIDPKLFRINNVQIAKHLYPMRNEQIILFLGRLVREKGAHLLLEAAPLILNSYPEAKFVFAGTGPALEDLQVLADRLQIKEKVVFLGYITDEERNMFLGKAKIAVFPSLYEPFGIAALEAMASGTPVVVSDVGGLSDTVDHARNGLKFYAGNPHSLADQVLELLANPVLATSLAQVALAEISRFNWEEIAETTFTLYQQVVKQSKTQKATG